MPKITGN